MASQGRFIRLFEEITAGDVALVEGKTASLGEMYRALRPRGVSVPNGFAITAEAYRHVLTQAQAWEELCEIPNNVLLIAEFSALFDGFSIGSNDLTQLTLGVDRDSATVAFEFDERDPGMQKMLKLAVEGCRHNDVHSGICGQAPSDYPEIAADLVRLGIDSISVNPDTVVKTTLAVLEVEGKLAAQERRDVA